MAKRILAMTLAVGLTTACETYEPHRYETRFSGSDLDLEDLEAIVGSKREPVVAAPPTEAELAAKRKALYAAGYRKGFAEERATYKKYGQLWPERLRRPVSCMALPTECGEADGRIGLHTAVRNGYEPCVRPDTACEARSAAVARRLAEVAAGWNDGYSRRLAVYFERGARNPEPPIQSTEVDCWEGARACALLKGWDDAGLAVEEGREPCSPSDQTCEQRRAAALYRDESLAPSERERMKAEATERARNESVYLRARLEAERAARRKALNAQAMALIQRLRSDATECTSSFGDRVLSEKPSALEEWAKLTARDRADFQRALSEERGEAAPNIARDAKEAQDELNGYVPGLCLFGR
jgi:hypothetical protein